MKQAWRCWVCLCLLSLFQIFPIFHLSVADGLASLVMMLISVLFLDEFNGYPGSTGPCGYMVAIMVVSTFAFSSGMRTVRRFSDPVGGLHVLTPSLPWCHLKTARKSAKFETLKPFSWVFVFLTGMWKDSSKRLALKTRCVRGPENMLFTSASFSWEILQAGAVKGLNACSDCFDTAGEGGPFGLFF